MSYHWESKFEFLNEENKSEAILNKSLENISLEEIKNLKKRVSFYLAHYMILARKNKLNTNDIKVDFLKKLDNALCCEIQTRENKASI